jgi:signal transduction histidine kinase
VNPVSAFFVRNIIVVFFFYGLAFFALGLALLLAARRRSEFHFVHAIRPLAAFGILHGLHEWYEMYQKYATLTGGYTPSVWDESLRLALLVASFIGLLAFGIGLLTPASPARWRGYAAIGGMLALWGGALLLVYVRFDPPPEEMMAVADVLARYSLGIPGAALGAWALMAQQRTFRAHNLPQFGRDLVWCAAALLLYGVVGQVFVRPTLLAPSQLLSSTAFLQWFGIPVQLFRAAMAGVLAFYMARALRAFEVEGQRRLEEALRAERRTGQERERLNAELQHEQKVLAELLDRLVDTQEVERQRIARELHDATGQSLTAIALGLRGVQRILEDREPSTAGQLRELESFSTSALGELRRIIADLRPPQLDDLGLIPALRWYTQNFQARWGVTCELQLTGENVRLAPEMETVIFRIVQEALSNVARHAQASRVVVRLEQDPQAVTVTVRDDGQGFDPTAQNGAARTRNGWGLLGIQERARLMGGRCAIESSPGQGTQVQVWIPLSNGTDRNNQRNADYAEDADFAD